MEKPGFSRGDRGPGATRPAAMCLDGEPGRADPWGPGARAARIGGGELVLLDVVPCYEEESWKRNFR